MLASHTRHSHWGLHDLGRQEYRSSIFNVFRILISLSLWEIVFQSVSRTMQRRPRPWGCTGRDLGAVQAATTQSQPTATNRPHSVAYEGFFLGIQDTLQDYRILLSLLSSKILTQVTHPQGCLDDHTPPTTAHARLICTQTVHTRPAYMHKEPSSPLWTPLWFENLFRL